MNWKCAQGLILAQSEESGNDTMKRSKTRIAWAELGIMSNDS